MLPKYRRLVEQLAQAGLLKVICGTDTLGVGINVPIRTVLFTGLSKYDGAAHAAAQGPRVPPDRRPGRAGRLRHRSARSSCRRPSTSIENEQALAKAGDDPKKRRKVVRKKPPEGFVGWGEPTFERLVAAEPEPLTSQLRGQPRDAAQRHRPARRRVRGDAAPAHRQPRGPRRASAGTSAGRSRSTGRCSPPASSSGSTEPDDDGRTVRLTVDLQLDFALNQPLSPFALAAIELLDRESPTYALDVRLGHRVHAGRPAPGALGAAVQGPRRGGRRR